MKRVAILGATGSIGASTLDVIARHPQQFTASVLTAQRNVDALICLCRQYHPDLAVIADPALESRLREGLSAAGLDTEAMAGPQALCEAASHPDCDIVVAAIVGAAGLESTLAAARAGKKLLLANKEAVVIAGPLLREAVKAGDATLVPLDSEHNAVFQCLPANTGNLDAAGIRRIILTASGGPFRGKTRGELLTVTPEQACAHPNWNMGRKISVDSATLMNKGLEVIEAHWLFGARADQIEVVVHPQSIVHSLVDYVDGSVLAQLGLPDMRTAIAHALAWPRRIDSGVATLDLAALGKLQFEAPDTRTFVCLNLAYRALESAGTAPAILNAANEVAVAAFLEGSLSFLSIGDLIEATLDAVACTPAGDLETLVHADLTARQQAQRIMPTMSC